MNLLERQCEPEIMDGDEEAKAYFSIDHSTANLNFVNAISQEIGYQDGLIVDVGCGPGDITIMLAERFPKAQIFGVDLSAPMIAIAREQAAKKGMSDERVKFILADGKSSALPAGSADLIVSNSVVHHVHEPDLLFKEIARLAKPTAALFLRDLRRPENIDELENLVYLHTRHDTDLQRKLFRDSLHAALRRNEVEDHIAAGGLKGCEVSLVGDLYWQLVRRPGRPRMTLIHRDDIPTLREVSIDGETHGLGIHKDFRRNPLLKNLMPEQGHFSVSWVHLEPNEVLAAHSHPVASMIIVCSGKGLAFGANELTFSEGDIIFVPPTVKHGFRGQGDRGYWALSVQFDGPGLYENSETPRVAFSQEEKIAALNQELMKRHLKNPIFNLIVSDQIADERCRARMFDAIQVWSNAFQKLVHLRCATAEGEHLVTAIHHFQEEFLHNERLREDRSGAVKEIWDAKLDGYCAWFQWKLLVESDYIRSAIVHLVLEGGALLFHGRAQEALGKYRETSHFETHSHADDEHFRMGFRLLEGLSAHQFTHLEKMLPEAWDMLDLVCERIAELSYDA